MIQRFVKVTDGLYRGGAPDIQDVKSLKDKYHINKIVSLDELFGKKIDRVCKLLNIEHIMIPIDGGKKSIINLLHYNLKDLLLKNGPTFVHCLEGKDRTGFVVALFECQYMGISSDKALEKAKSLDFGLNADPRVIQLFEKIVRSCKPKYNNKKIDNNSADIVSNEREYIGDNRDSFLDESRPSSFAPYLSINREYPYDSVYNSINDQSPTRENFDEEIISSNGDATDIPLVGQYNNNAGIHGAGPVESPGGFIFD